MSDYFVLTVKNLPSTQEEALSDRAFSMGALGISEILAFDQPEGEETVWTKNPETRSVEIYFAAAPSTQSLEDLRGEFPKAELGVRGEVNRDWLAEWKKGFKPFALTEGHWVVPSWCEPPKEAKHVVWIDPGMAFGTGTHETTQLVAEYLKDLVPELKPQSCLDVGTGTGILAVLARQLGIKDIVGTEIEEDSRRVAHENFAANKCADIVLDEKQVGDLTRTFDIVLANIIDGALVRIQDDLKARVKPGGWLVLSGIITEREKDFLEGFQLPKGVKWMKRVQKGDWLLYAVRL